MMPTLLDRYPFATARNCARTLALCLFAAGALCVGAVDSTAPTPDQMRSDTTMATSNTQTSPYFSVDFDGTKLTALRPDVTGKQAFKDSLIAQTGSWSGVGSVEFKGDELLLTPSGTEQVWELPFVSEGYYDSDRHLNYPNPVSTEGATPLVLPIRRFVTCAGQELPIEYFKRLKHDDPSWVFLNMSRAHQLLLVGDATLGYDLLLTAPGTTRGSYQVFADRLALKFGDLTGSVRLQVLPHGKMEMPGNALGRPRVKFSPDFEVTDTFSGNTLSASQAATELFRQGLYWFPSAIGGGDWGQCTTQYVTVHDPRSPMLNDQRKKILSEMGTFSYDRFGHFGLKHAWGQYPDYGAGALMNMPENNAAWDWRMIHLNGQWAMTLATYTLGTGDTSVLNARRSRWLATDAEPQHPLAAYTGKDLDAVLAAGDVRLDRKPLTTVFTLGQTFTAAKPFKSVTLRLSNDGNFPATGNFTLRKLAALDQPFTDAIVTRTTFTLQPSQKDEPMRFDLPEEQPAGFYFAEIADARSARNVYFGPAIGWFTDYEGDYDAGFATHGPLVGGTNYDRAKLMMNYLIEYTGGAKEGLSYYIDDPEYNVPDQKSGRPKVCTAGTFNERAAGGHDAQEGMYYNAGLKAMIELAKVTGKPEDVAYYQDLLAKANAAYLKRYWRTVNEGGQTFSRFIGTEDWDGVIHDYGYTFENMETLARGVGGTAEAQAVTWWLDRGRISLDDGKTFTQDIYSLWHITAPYNTINADTYPNLTGMLPYTHVVTNGGSRLDTGSHELLVRSKFVSSDNLHERIGEILGRSINPDRLTGGRSFDDPGGRGRWHFGPPFENLADIEGFREIFPTNGAMISNIQFAYLGAETCAEGLRLRPDLPSSLDSLTLEGIGYGGSTLNFEYSANRKPVAAEKVTTQDATIEFTAAQAFNKVGVKLQVEPDQPGQVSLTLEVKGAAGWEAIATNWYSKATDGEIVSVPARKLLDPKASYRLRIHDLKHATLPADAQPVILAEQITTTITATYPENANLTLLNVEGKPLAAGAQVIAEVEAGQTLLLTTKR